MERIAGQGFEVHLEPAAQTIPFGVIEGAKVPTNGNFSFGSVTAIVDPSGAVGPASQGVDAMENATCCYPSGNDVRPSQCRLYSGPALSDLLSGSNRSSPRTIDSVRKWISPFPNLLSA
jgi:hypothetical protein